MPVTWHRVSISSSGRTELLDITDAVARVVRDHEAAGLAVIYCPHTTAGVIIQEAESGLLRDLEGWFKRAVPQEGSYQHDRVDDNAASHLRAVVAGASAIVPVTKGRLGLGPWQRILLVELDGPRVRQVEVGVVV